MPRVSRRWMVLAGLVVVVSGVALTALDRPVQAQPGPGGVFGARLTGPQEAPSILSGARGTFEARLVDGGNALQYRLTYQNLTSPLFMAHIHIGQHGVNGGITIWLCDNPGGPLDDPTGLAPACDGTTSGEVTGTVDADNVIAIASQNVADGQFEKVLRAIREGVAYVNVHTTNFGLGEIRGQIQRGTSPPRP